MATMCFMNQRTYSALIGATPAGRLPRLFAVAASGFSLVCSTEAGTELELLLDFSTGKTDTSPSSAIIPANSFPVFLVSRSSFCSRMIVDPSSSQLLSGPVPPWKTLKTKRYKRVSRNYDTACVKVKFSS